MISTNTRLKLEDIAARIAGGLNVTLEEMTLIQKWADRHTTVATMLRRARRRAIQGEPAEGSMDSFMEAMDLGFEDPTDHLQGPQNPEDIYNFFKRDDADDWRTRD